ncbi:MAG: RecX family transcriptional regulator [Saprospiraceae bacterium]|nr:RecX family transcriptional regulator [Saprospiraceae bacterium]
MQEPKKKYWSSHEALPNMQKYCAYQERCHSEVRSKLLENGVFGDLLEEIIAELITDGYLNEERFARSYVRGKFRMKQWGRMKIINELKMRRISDYCIKAGLSEINEDEYRETLDKILKSKLNIIKSNNKPLLKKKAVDYALSRGFEYNLILTLLEDS